MSQLLLLQVGRKGESLGFVRLAGGKRLGDTCYLRFAFTSFDEEPQVFFWGNFCKNSRMKNRPSAFEEGSCFAASNGSLPLTRTSTMEDTRRNNDSFYGALLKQYQKQVLTDSVTSEHNNCCGYDDQTSGKKIQITFDHQSRDRRSISYRNSILDSSNSSGCSTGSTSSHSLYPRITDAIFEKDHLLDFAHDQHYDLSQESGTKMCEPILSHRKPELELPLSSSQRADNFSERSECSTECASSTVLSRMSSFYVEALREASGRSILNGAIASDQDIGVQLERDESGEHFFGSTYHNQQKVCTAMVDEPESHNELETDSSTEQKRKIKDENERLKSTTLLASSQVSDRARRKGSNLFQAQKGITSASSSLPALLSYETEAIISNRLARSFIDETYESSVTRSSVMPHLANSVVYSAREIIDSHEKSGDKYRFAEKNNCHNLREWDSSATSANKNEESKIDDDVSLALSLSVIKSSENCSLDSGVISSDSISNGESRDISEKQSKNNYSFDNIFTQQSLNGKNNNFLRSQVKAMEEYQGKCKSNGTINLNPGATSHFSERHISGESSRDTKKVFTGESKQRRRSKLERRGALETRQAISNGNAHIVKCQGCSGRLQAPVHYSLVFCPKCQTVSPA